MNKTIDYFYAPISGYAYLGEKKLVALAQAKGASINFKPVDIAQVFSQSQTTAPFKQSQARLNYRFRDMQRIADKLQLKINPKPKYWPVPMELAATTIYSATDMGIDPHLVSFAILSAAYTEELDVSDEATIQQILNKLGLNGEEILNHRKASKILACYESATQSAIELGVFGSPSYVVDGELFFGQDRLDTLAEFL